MGIPTSLKTLRRCNRDCGLVYVQLVPLILRFWACEFGFWASEFGAGLVVQSKMTQTAGNP